MRRADLPCSAAPTWSLLLSRVRGTGYLSSYLPVSAWGFWGRELGKLPRNSLGSFAPDTGGLGQPANAYLFAGLDVLNIDFLVLVGEPAIGEGSVQVSFGNKNRAGFDAVQYVELI